MIYAPYEGALVTDKQPGFVAKAWIALPEWLTADSVLDATPTAMGDSLVVTTGPAFAAGKGALPIECFRDSVEVPGESSGEMGSLILLFKPKIFIKGDSPAALELIQDIINRPHILWVRKAGSGCAGTIQQYGSLCDPAEIESANPSTGTLRTGKSGYEVTYESTVKYFFGSAITLTEYP